MFIRRIAVRPAIIATTLATAAALAVVAGGATTAQAQTTHVTTPQHCPYGVVFYRTSGVRRYLVVSKEHYITSGQGGTHLALSIAKGSSTAGATTHTGSFTINGVVGSGQYSVSKSITDTTTTTVTTGDDYTIPKSWKNGWLAWGSWGYEYHWESGTYVDVCTWHEVGHGVAKMPVKATGFFKGEGTKPPLS
jgi:hypothetical protein